MNSSRSERCRPFSLLSVVALLAVMALLVPCSSAVAQQDAAAGEEGTTIQLDPAPNRRGERVEGLRDRRPARPPVQPQAVSRYWLGILGGPVSDTLRSHVDLPEGVGIVVQRVMPDSPAEEGELAVHDIITHAEGKPISNIAELADAVGDQGERGARLTLDLVRGGQRRTLWVDPVKRPIDQLPPQWPQQQRPRFGEPFGHEGFGGRAFRGQFGGPFGGAVPGGISVSVEQQNDGPRRIIIERGDEKWEIEGDDPEALAELPEELRPMVEGLLGEGPQQGFGLPFGVQPQGEGRLFGAPMFEGQPQIEPGLLEERMRAMEAELEALRDRVAPPAAAPPAAPEEPTVPDAPGEIELPAE